MTTVHYYLGRPARVWISAHSRRSPARQSRTGSEHIRSGLPSDVAPAGGLLARRRIAIARFGADVAAAGGIGPALAAGLDPAGYPVVPGGVPQAWERAQVYLGLYERYQELYQAQVTELHLLMATAPGCSPALIAPPSADRSPDGHPHGLHITQLCAPPADQTEWAVSSTERRLSEVPIEKVPVTSGSAAVTCRRRTVRMRRETSRAAARRG